MAKRSEGATAKELAACTRKLDAATVRRVALANQRDNLIRRMRAEGATLKEIADIAKMTPPGVQRVLDRTP